MARSSRLRTVAWASLAILYVAAFPYHPKLRSPNELSRLWQARSIVEYGTIEINNALRDFGHVGDMSRIDDERGPHFYPSKAPLMSFAAAPIYWVLRAVSGGHLYAVKELPQVYWSRLLLTVLPTLLMLWALRRFLGAYLPAPVTDALIMVYALGTLAFSYSLLFMSHQPTAVLLFGGFYAAWRCARGDWRERGWLVAGAFSGATVAAEYTGALGVIGLALFTLVALLGRRQQPLPSRLTAVARAAVLVVLGALPFLVALGAYHQAAYGHPLESGYKHLNDPGYQGWHLGGFLGIRYPDPVAFAHSFFSPLRGLFSLSPVLLLAVPGLWLLFKETRATASAPTARSSLLAPEPQQAAGRFAPPDRALCWLSLALLAGYTYFTSAFEHTSWGWTTGPRHLTGLVPFLLLPVGLLVVHARKRSAPLLGLYAGLFAASILVTGALTFVNYIPDNVSAPLFGLAVPLFEAGYLPPSIFWAAGLENPASGALLVLVLLAAAALCVFILVVPAGEADPAQRKRALVNGGVALLVVVGFLGLHAAFTRNDDADRGATGFLKSVWLAPPSAPR